MNLLKTLGVTQKKAWYSNKTVLTPEAKAAGLTVLTLGLCKAIGTGAEAAWFLFTSPAVADADKQVDTVDKTTTKTKA